MERRETIIRAFFTGRKITANYLELREMHESILLLGSTNQDRPGFLKALGDIYCHCYETIQTIDDLDQAISAYEDAVRDCGTDTNHLGDLGNALRLRFERLGDVGDINRSVSFCEKAAGLNTDGSEDPLRLSDLGKSLLRRFERLAGLDDIEKSVLVLQKALDLVSDQDPDKSSRLSDLGNSLLRRFLRLGASNDINKSVMLLRNAVSLTPSGDSRRVPRLNNLGNCLRRRFMRFGNLSDINDSVSVFKEAVALTPDSNPNKPPMASAFDDLGRALFLRFERLGDIYDIEQSVSQFQTAVRLTPDDDPDKVACLSNLANSLLCRFERIDNLDDIDKALSIFQEAVDLLPEDHPNKPLLLTNLANAMSARFKRLGDLEDMNKSLSFLRKAVLLTPNDHVDKALRLGNLGGSLVQRFKTLGDFGDIEASSVLVFKAAIALVPDGHPRKPCISSGLAHSLFLRFIRFGDPQDRTDMFVQFQYAACAGTGPTSLRFVVSSRWAQLAQVFQHPSTLEAYNVALGLLPQLAWLGLSISDRHHHILQAGTVVRDAGAAAIAACQYEKAVEWLEQGRSVIWGQILDLRTSVDTLRYRYPGLADELVSLSTQLEGAGIRETSPKLVQASAHGSIQSIADLHHHHAHKREDLLKTIRALEGFERFLLPKPISELLPGAQGGPVVILNISGIRCDGLVLRPGLENIILHVALPNCTQDNVRKMIESLQHLLHNTGCSERLTGQREGHVYVPPETRLSDILSELWSRIARPVLDALAIKVSYYFPQRIWWCPTGPLAFLPLHAAGVYGENEAFGTKLSDFVISSYTPSLTALIQGFRSPSRSQDELQLLAVAQPSADGQNCIPGTQEELDHIQWLAKGKVPILRLEGNSASLRSVQEGMKKSRWVHFACHGVQDVSHPTESALLLAGSSRLTLSNIIQLSLPNAEFAFLSACQTATGAKDLQEESVHLAAGMLLAGYRGVIATMWSIMDNDAPQVAADVYEHLFKTSPPDPTRAAEALHLAVRKLREGSGRKKSLFRWVPFIHVGV
ncbi:CHAT domain-containing protein [Mycena epipterygia]|nr:CHAT domain-containing protein [Mycena epipterygia]